MKSKANPSFPLLVRCSPSPFFRIFASRALSASAATEAGAAAVRERGLKSQPTSFLASVTLLYSSSSSKFRESCYDLLYPHCRNETRTKAHAGNACLDYITGQGLTEESNKIPLSRLEMSDYSFAHIIIRSLPHSLSAVTSRVSSLIRSSSSTPSRN